MRPAILFLLLLTYGCAKKPVAKLSDLDGQWTRHHIKTPTRKQPAEFSNGRSKMIWSLESLKEIKGWDVYVHDLKTLRIDGDKVHLKQGAATPILVRQPTITRIEIMVEANMRAVAEAFIEAEMRGTETVRMKMISKDEFHWTDDEGDTYVFRRAPKGTPPIPN